MADTTTRAFPLYTVETSRSFQVVDDYPHEWTRSIVAIDPGGEHVGVSMFAEYDDAWECVWSGEMSPDEFWGWYSEMMWRGLIDIVVYETWTLYPDKAQQQIGSDMPTSQLIGVIKYVHWATRDGSNRWPGGTIELIGQPASIKTPIRSVLKNRKLTSMAKFLRIPLDHAADSELHGYYHLIHTMKAPIKQRLIPHLKQRGLTARQPHK